MSKLMTTTTLSAGLLLITACGVAPSGPSDLPTIEAQAAPGAASSTTSAPTAHTSRKRPGQFQPPSNCSMGQELSLQIGSRGKGTVEVASNYQNADAGCAGLAWELGAGSSEEVLPSESFPSSSGEGLRLYHADSSLQGVWVVATAPDRQVARIYVAFDASPSSDETN